MAQHEFSVREQSGDTETEAVYRMRCVDAMFCTQQRIHGNSASVRGCVNHLKRNMPLYGPSLAKPHPSAQAWLNYGLHSVLYRRASVQ